MANGNQQPPWNPLWMQAINQARSAYPKYVQPTVSRVQSVFQEPPESVMAPPETWPQWLARLPGRYDPVKLGQQWAMRQVDQPLRAGATSLLGPTIGNPMATALEFALPASFGGKAGTALEEEELALGIDPKAPGGISGRAIIKADPNYPARSPTEGPGRYTLHDQATDHELGYLNVHYPAGSLQDEERQQLADRGITDRASQDSLKLIHIGMLEKGQLTGHSLLPVYRQLMNDFPESDGVVAERITGMRHTRGGTTVHLWSGPRLRARQAGTLMQGGATQPYTPPVEAKTLPHWKEWTEYWSERQRPGNLARGGPQTYDQWLAQEHPAEAAVRNIQGPQPAQTFTRRPRPARRPGETAVEQVDRLRAERQAARERLGAGEPRISAPARTAQAVRGMAARQRGASDLPHWDEYNANPQGVSYPRWLREQHPGEAAARYDTAPVPADAERVDVEESRRRERNLRQFGTPTLEEQTRELGFDPRTVQPNDPSRGLRGEGGRPLPFNDWFEYFQRDNRIIPEMAQHMKDQGIEAYYREWADPQQGETIHRQGFLSWMENTYPHSNRRIWSFGPPELQPEVPPPPSFAGVPTIEEAGRRRSQVPPETVPGHYRGREVGGPAQLPEGQQFQNWFDNFIRQNYVGPEQAENLRGVLQSWWGEWQRGGGQGTFENWMRQTYPEDYRQFRRASTERQLQRGRELQREIAPLPPAREPPDIRDIPPVSSRSAQMRAIQGEAASQPSRFQGEISEARHERDFGGPVTFIPGESYPEWVTREWPGMNQADPRLLDMFGRMGEAADPTDVRIGRMARNYPDTHLGHRYQEWQHDIRSGSRHIETFHNWMRAQYPEEAEQLFATRQRGPERAQRGIGGAGPQISYVPGDSLEQYAVRNYPGRPMNPFIENEFYRLQRETYGPSSQRGATEAMRWTQYEAELRTGRTEMAFPEWMRAHYPNEWPSRGRR